eukprot:TRINITY_DN7545_c0_g2_i2.p1 TRINITY_DN7545_c0_g2~~TRINITY_DN7545_c0_g2_i2.p1  ORF type:complete len:203 (-),score=49.99 TRINITY_DN7545_c0_g2_i2:50-658(-)
MNENATVLPTTPLPSSHSSLLISTNPYSPFPSQPSHHQHQHHTTNKNDEATQNSNTQQQKEKHTARLLSSQVATRWYKSPELLWGSRNYDCKVDMWAAACVFAELLSNTPLFPGETDINQLWHIILLLGTPNSTVWPSISSLPDYGKIMFDNIQHKPLASVFPSNCPDSALSLLRKILQWDPLNRLIATEALQHDYFKEILE